MAAPKKKKSTAKKKAPAKKQAAAKKTASAKKAPARKKAAAKKASAKKTAATKKAAPAKKSAAKNAPAKKAAPAKKSAAKKAPAKKQAAAGKAPAKKTTAKKTTAKQTARQKTAAKKTDSPVTPKPKQSIPPKPKPKRKSSSPLSPLLSNDVPEQVEVPKPRGTSKDGISYTKDFDVKFLKAQRDQLEARKAGELARATRLEDEATSIIEDGEMGDVQFDDEGGEGDTMVVQRDLDRLLSGQARQTVADIDEALARIEAGTYGYSVVSGKPIPRERLEAIPETTVLAVEKVSGAGFR